MLLRFIVAVRMNLSFRTAMLITSLGGVSDALAVSLFSKTRTGASYQNDAHLHILKDAQRMRKSVKTQYQAKVTDDSGRTRSKVPIPLLRQMGARAGDYMMFRLTGAGKVEMLLSREKKTGTVRERSQYRLR